MSEGAEGIGEAVTGGMIARAVEPEAGELRPDKDPGRCLNCGAALVGAFCHGCGQSAHVHRSLHAWWHDFLHSVLHLEGKMWRTLPLLAWRPGELTRRYIDGERARFVSPLALFLFSVFTMFAAMSIAGGSVIGMDDPRAGVDIAGELRAAQAQVDTLEAERRAAAARRGDVAAVDRRLEGARRERDALRDAQEFAAAPRELRTGWGRLDEGIKKANENRSLFFYKVQTNAYKFSWALIPISVPFLWLLFLHRRRYREEFKAYDHMAFVTYSISFMSLGLVVLILLNRIGIFGAIVGLATIIVPPVHIYRQLRGAYRLGALSALWRTALLLFLASVAMLVFGLLLLTLGVLG
ncbi:MAG TPA: DUF3667 domain-containing protein [Allosphingosinicella sp.]|jgi:hypothetical protein